MWGIIILDGAQTLSRTHLLWFRQSKLARASNNLAMGSIEFFVTRVNSWGFEPHQKLHFWIGPQLFTVTMFFGTHVLCMKAEHYTSSLQPSWLLPTPLWTSTVWHFGSELKSSSGYNPSCIYVVYVCSSVYFHRMSPNTACNCLYIWTSPLCSSCACRCMSISLCRYRVLILFLSFFTHIYIYIHLYL